jgi:hypothetical protein
MTAAHVPFSPTAPMTTAAMQPPPSSPTRFLGWAGIAAILMWMGFAAWRSPSGIQDLEGPVWFEVLAFVLLGAMMRWPPPTGASPFARLGAVVLLSWLLSSWVGAWSMNWGDEPWLIAMVQTFQHLEHFGRFMVVVVAVALVSSVSRRRELWILGPLAVVVGVVAERLSLPGAVVIGGVWWAGRVIRGTATRRWTVHLALVTALGTAPEAGAVVCGYGGSYGSDLFFFPHVLLVAFPVVCPLLFVGLGVAGGVALRRHRAGPAARLWAAGLGIGGLDVGNSLLGGCGAVVMGTGPMLLVLAAGPRTRWSTLSWGVASALASGLMAAWRYDSGRFVAPVLIMFVGATVAFWMLHHHALARRRGLQP